MPRSTGLGGAPPWHVAPTRPLPTARPKLKSKTRLRGLWYKHSLEGLTRSAVLLVVVFNQQTRPIGKASRGVVMPQVQR
jgi:hypothetical protein